MHAFILIYRPRIEIQQILKPNHTRRKQDMQISGRLHRVQTILYALFDCMSWLRYISVASTEAVCAIIRICQMECYQRRCVFMSFFEIFAHYHLALRPSRTRFRKSLISFPVWSHLVQGNMHILSRIRSLRFKLKTVSHSLIIMRGKCELKSVFVVSWFSHFGHTYSSRHVRIMCIFSLIL